MSIRRPQTRRRWAVLAVAVPLAFAIAPAWTAASSMTASSMTSSVAASPAPPRGVGVVRPIAAAKVTKVVYDRANPARGAAYRAACGTPVVAAHPGVALVGSRPSWRGRTLVQLTTQNGLVTYYRYLGSTSIRHGQLVQAGQQLGVVAQSPANGRCEMTLHVQTTRMEHAAIWINWWQGRPVLVRAMYNDRGFEVASFNILGANHTDPGGSKASWPNYDARMPGTIEMLDRYGVDVAGLQEFQWRQRTMLLDRTGNTWGVYPGTQNDNSIIWRKSEFTFVSGTTFLVPYFDGKRKPMPIVLLRDNDTGRTAYFVNVHNPATNRIRGNQDRWRYEAVTIERQKVIELRAQGRPVFLTGDFNDRAKAFCPLTAQKLMISPDSVPSMTCRMPASYYWVDWIFAAGQARSTTLTVDTSTVSRRISDHPIVVTRTHLAD
jgi:endonuclease/exonuclease/phosphatase family metal-dependent hydrolase